MGYNRSGTRRTKRLKRRKRHEMRLLAKAAAQQQPQEAGLMSKVKTASQHAAEKIASVARTAAEKVGEAAKTVVDTVKDKVSGNT
jgi:hypothetical protein